MAANRIYIQVDFQAEDANAKIHGLNQNIKSVGTTSQNATKQAEAGFKGLSVEISSATRGLEQMAGMMAGLGLVRLGGLMVQASDDVKKTTAAFKAMGAEGYEAANAIEQIRAVAAKSPFSFDDMREMGQRLRGFGFDLKAIPGMLENITDAAAALGKGKIGIDAITLALGQMHAKGIIQGQEAFRQLAEQGINATKYLRDAIKKETGRAVSELDVRKMIEKQMIGAEKGVQVILDGIKKDFGGLGAVLAEQLPSAQFEKLTDDLKQLGGVIANDFAPQLISAIKLTREWIQAFRLLPAPVRDATVVLGGLVTVLTVIGGFAKLGLFAWIPGAVKLITELATTVALLGSALAAGGGGIEGFFSRLLLIGTRLGPILAALATAMAAVAAAASGMMLGAWVREKIPPDSWLGRLLGRDMEERLKEFGAKSRADLEATAKVYQKWMLDMKIEGAEKGPAVPFAKQSLLELQDSLREMRGKLDAEAVAVKARNAKLIQESKEAAEHQNEIAQQMLEAAQAREAGAIFGLTAKYSGRFKEVQGNIAATAKVMEAFNTDLRVELAKVEADQKKTTVKHVEELRKEFEEANKYRAELFQKHMDYVLATNDIEMDAIRDRLAYEETALAADRDHKLAEMDQVHRQTLEQEIAYQQESLKIKTEYAYRIRDIQLELEQQDFNRKVANEFALNQAKLVSDVDYVLRVYALHATQQDRVREIIKNTDIAIAKDRLDTAKKTNDAIIDEQKKIYDKLKSSLDRVFDALLDKSTSIWQAIGNAMKTAIIGAIKEIVTSRAAAALMQIFGYGTVSFGGGPRGLGGQQPVFGGGGAGGGGSILGRLLGLGGAVATAAPGATATATIPAQAYGISLAGVGGGAAPARLAGFGASLGSLLPAAAVLGGGALALNGIQRGGKVGLAQTGVGGAAAGFGAAALTGGLGMGLSAIGGGVLGAGIGLAGYGMYRGGKAAIPLTAAGGAMIGAVLGTALFPGIGTLLGAGIGAAVGGIAGLFRSLVKTADQKLQTKLKQVYGIDVQDKAVRAQILEAAKQKYGGNLDMAVRSPEVQELVRLYAMSTGQNASGMARPMYAATFAQSGGALSMQPVYSNGLPVSSPYTGTTTSQWAQAGLYVQLNPQQATDLFEGKVVNVIQNNPAAIAESNASGTLAGNARNSQRTALLEPLTVVR